jgi:hypothetical protein
MMAVAQRLAGGRAHSYCRVVGVFRGYYSRVYYYTSCDVDIAMFVVCPYHCPFNARFSSCPDHNRSMSSPSSSSRHCFDLVDSTSLQAFSRASVATCQIRGRKTLVKAKVQMQVQVRCRGGVKDETKGR